MMKLSRCLTAAAIEAQQALCIAIEAEEGNPRTVEGIGCLAAPLAPILLKCGPASRGSSTGGEAEGFLDARRG